MTKATAPDLSTWNKTMHIERLTKIAEWLEGGAVHENLTFDMDSGLVLTEKAWAAGDLAACGTSCCIAGAAVAFFSGDEDKNILLSGEASWVGRHHDRREAGWYAVRQLAQDLLGLDYGEANKLFTPRIYSLMAVDAAWAARTVRHLIETGAVEWDYNRE